MISMLLLIALLEIRQFDFPPITSEVCIVFIEEIGSIKENKASTKFIDSPERLHSLYISKITDTKDWGAGGRILD